MLRAVLQDYSNAYIVVKGTTTVIRPNNSKISKSIAFKNNAPFVNSISKINGVLIDNAEDLNVVTTMHNLPEYSKNYRKKQPTVCGIITEMNQIILFPLILNLLNAKRALQEILITSVLVMLVMMQKSW